MTDYGIMVMQANLQRSKLATQELVIEAQKRKIDVALIQEPYVGAPGVVGGYPGARVVQHKGPIQNKPVKAAIMIFNDKLEIIIDATTICENIVVTVVRTGEWRIGFISVYFEGTEPLEPYLGKLKGFLMGLGTNRIILGGDVNSWSPWWGSSREDSRGEVLRGFLNEMDLHILNQGTDPTFNVIRGDRNYTSCVDITVCTAQLLPVAEGWRVDGSVTGSDHGTIIFKLKLSKPVAERLKGGTRKYNTKKAKWEEFQTSLESKLTARDLNEEKINRINSKLQLEETVNSYIGSISEACDATIPEKKPYCAKAGAAW